MAGEAVNYPYCCPYCHTAGQPVFRLHLWLYESSADRFYSQSPVFLPVPAFVRYNAQLSVRCSVQPFVRQNV